MNCGTNSNYLYKTEICRIENGKAKCRCKKGFTGDKCLIPNCEGYTECGINGILIRYRYL